MVTPQAKGASDVARLTLAVICLSSSLLYGQSKAGVRVNKDPALTVIGECSAELVGEWTAIDSNTRDLTQVTIARQDAGHLQVRAFGACVPKDCDLGT